MKKQYSLVCDLLDMQMFDSARRNLGKVDGIALHVAPGKQPRVTYLENGALVLARRVGKPWERLVAFLTRHFAVRRNPVLRLAWEKVANTGREIHIDIDGLASEAYAWEHWLNDRLIRRLPFAHQRDDDEQ